MTVRTTLRNRVWPVIIIVFLVLTPCYARKSKPVDPIEKEVKIGRDAAKEVEKDSKVITDPAIVARVKTIGEKIAAIAVTDEAPASYGDSKVVKYNYTFKVIDKPSVNAFCLPGGFVYVHKGLLDFVQSDHELAAVLAHEIAHAAHHHTQSLIREQSKLQGKLALILIAGLIGNVPQRDMGNLMLGTEFYKIAKLNGYGQLAEKDADATALEYISKTDYNPVGMLTFLERLGRRPDLVNLGIYQTHPRTDERIASVMESLNERHIKIERRKVTKAAIAEVRDAKLKDQTVSEVLIGGKSVVKLSGDKARAQKLAVSINRLLDDGVAMRDLSPVDGRCQVVARGQLLCQITPEDAKLNSDSTPEDTADHLADGIRRVIWQEMVELLR